VRDDSRRVGPGDLFVALPGTKVDGRAFVDQAVAAGAAVIVTEGDPAGLPAGLTWVRVPSARQALGLIAANRFGAGDRLCLTAVTGTNGKTTTTYLMEAILAAAGRRPGVVGTVQYRFEAQTFAANLTTPGALELHGLFAQMRQAGATDVVMEASSIALDQGRLAGCRFQVTGLSNVTQDHLDYHGTMDRYFDAKAILFERLLAPGGAGVVFVDREDGRRMRDRIRGRVLTVSTEAAGAADVRVEEAHLTEDGTRASFATPVGRIEVESPLVGGFNLSNLTLAVGMAIAHGIAPAAIAQGLRRLAAVPGRLERVPNARGVLCAVDYAHTPDAVERAIGALRPLTTGRLIVVLGCGGDRDPTKRPLMGAAAARLGDVAVITSDNPRTEDPARILEMIVAGVQGTGAPALAADALAGADRGYHVERDRRTAIRRAIAAAGRGDTVLIAGKGHEDYQILGTTKIHFDDREEAAAAFAALDGGDAPAQEKTS
jgi:UDP-N-acetylmuramoyl-L-alanyl-D-glutamate--2,6-diaminopimelate ligase